MNQIETVYRQHASALLRFIWGLCGDRDEAEDIVSETFVRILTRAPKIETRTARAYLLAVARNTYLTGLRRRKRETRLPDEIPASNVDPSGRMDDRSRLQVVIRALHDLPEGERAALLLRVDHDLPYEDISSSLGISVGAARVRVHRARLRLTTVLEQEGVKDETRSDT